MSKYEELMSKYQVIRKPVLLSDIKKNLEVYPRVHIDPGIVEEYAVAIRSGESFDPVVLSSDYVLIDGYHRVSAYSLLGKSQIEALVIQTPLTLEEIFSLAVEINLRHGKRFTKKDLERIRSLYSSKEVMFFFSKYAKELFKMEEEEKEEGLEEAKLLKMLEQESVEEEQDFAEQQKLVERVEKEREEKEEKEREEEGEEEIKKEIWGEEVVRKKQKFKDKKERALELEEVEEEVEEVEDENKILENILEGIEKEEKKWISVTSTLYGSFLRMITAFKKNDPVMRGKVRQKVLTTSSNIICFGLSLLREWIILAEDFAADKKNLELKNLKNLIKILWEFYKNFDEELPEEIGFSYVLKSVEENLSKTQ